MDNTRLVSFIRDVFHSNEFIPLHEPRFDHREKQNLLATIDSTFVSSVGKFVDSIEQKIQKISGSPRAVATVNGTSALHTALYLSGVGKDDLVLTQALTFIATCNALYHLGAEPVFIDINRVSLGMCPNATRAWLEKNAQIDDKGCCIHTQTGKTIKAVLPMHTFGHPVQLDEFVALCSDWHLILIEDAAESLGSYYKGIHTGTLGRFGTLSFNGNKIVTTGGGGMILCRDMEDGKLAKHITTTAKRPHPYEFYHDQSGFNYRMPNLNAALGCAQLEKLSDFLYKKRLLAKQYASFFAETDLQFVEEPAYAQSNYWLNAVICPNSKSRDILLKDTNDRGVMTRPVWKLMNKLPMFIHAMHDGLENSCWAEMHIVNLPSSVPPEDGEIVNDA